MEMIKNKTNALAAGLLMAGTLLAGAAQSEETLRIYNWSDYIAEDTIANFEKETGIKVIYDFFDSNELLQSKLLAGKSGYDLVVPSATFLGRQIKIGLFQKLDKAKLPNLKHVWDVVSERTAIYDPGNDYSVNYLWGTTGIGYNKKLVAEQLGEDAPTDSWDLLFKPEYAEKLAACGIYMLDAPQDVIPIAMRYLGLDPQSLDPADFNKAAEMLAKVRPFVKKFNSSEFINALANGDICVALGWSGDIFQAADRADEANNGVSVAYNVPKEGTLMWFDMMAIPTDADNPEAAHKFIDYILRPEVVAEITDYVVYANGNKTSQSLIDPEILNSAAVYPDAATLENLFVTLPYDSKALRAVNRTWQKIKAGN